jgi:hypothetical protein
MKTQISQLKSGTKNQIVNSKIDYSTLAQATSHVGHSGSSAVEVQMIWNQVTQENPETMKIRLMDLEIELTANWSMSRKSVSYHGSISKSELEDKFGLCSSEKATPSISIQDGNLIVVSNGKKAYTHICPSLIEIL